MNIDETILTTRRRSPARSTRILCGTFYRAACWPFGSVIQSATEVILRLSAPTSMSALNHMVTVSGNLKPMAPRKGVAIPSRLLSVASAFPLTRRQDAIDSAVDLSTGWAMLAGAIDDAAGPSALRARTLSGAASKYGFGWTMWALPAKTGITPAEFALAIASDRSAIEDRAARGMALSILQRTMADDARAALATQWLAEAADANYPPLDRVRRVIAAHHIDALRVAQATFGTDDIAHRLGDYIVMSIASDTDGAEAWQRFRSQRDNAAADTRGTASEREVQERVEDDASRAALDDAQENYDSDAAEHTAQESAAEGSARRNGNEKPVGEAMSKRTAKQREEAADAEAEQFAARAAKLAAINQGAGPATEAGNSFRSRPLAIMD